MMKWTVVVPSDVVQAQVLIDLVQSCGWEKVAIISTADTYGTGLANGFLGK